MTKGACIARYLSAFTCSLIFVYLVWIGAQYVFTNKVVLDFVDGFIAITVAWYITRDIINIDNRLRFATQFSKQKAHQ